jgi:hypothetical protein
MARCAQRPSERPVRSAVTPVGASRLLMPLRRWNRASPIHGDHAIALRGVILANSDPHVEVHSRLPSRLLLGRSWDADILPVEIEFFVYHRRGKLPALTHLKMV